MSSSQVASGGWRALAVVDALLSVLIGCAPAQTGPASSAAPSSAHPG